MKRSRTENTFPLEEEMKKRKTEKERAESEEREKQPIGKVKESYQLYFKFEKRDNEKFGICVEYAKNNINKAFKMKNSNTSGLKKHLKSSHQLLYQKMFSLNAEKEKNHIDKQQSTLDDLFSNGSVKNVNWSRTLVSWLGYKRLPFSFFNDDCTQKFFALFNSHIKIPKRNAMKEIVMAEFQKMQENVKVILKKNKSKLSFSIDGWTAQNMTSYYGITVHFIDENYSFNSFALDLVAAKGKHTGKHIAELFLTTLKYYRIHDRIQGITVDNAAANTSFMKELSTLLKKENLIFDWEDQHFRCFAHIINLAVQDILKLMNVEVIDAETNSTTVECDNSEADDLYEINDDSLSQKENKQFFRNLITKIRCTFKKLRSSEALINKLKSFCEAMNIDFLKPILDVRTRWNSTYDMLLVANKLKSALTMLWDTSIELSNFKLSDVEWCSLQQILVYLKHFKHVSTAIGGEKNAILPTAVVAFNMLIDKIKSIAFKLDNKIDRNASDELLLLAIQKGRDKLLKHYKKCNWIYCVSLILDPRHKVETFHITDWGKELKVDSIKKFEIIFKENYYISSNTKNDSIDDNHCNSMNSSEDDVLDLSAIYVHKNLSSTSWKSEIRNYLEAPRAHAEIDVLEWWKVHSYLYPNLSKMARDVFSILATSVPVERIFSAVSLTITDNRCSLQDESLRALLCINSWMKCNLKHEICEVNI